MTDEELQELLDSDQPLPKETNTDMETYLRLYDALDSSVHSRLSPGFAHRVTARIKQDAVSDSKVYITLLLSALAMIVLAGVALIVLGGLSEFTLPGFTLQAIYLLSIVLILSILYSRIEKKAGHHM